MYDMIINIIEITKSCFTIMHISLQCYKWKNINFKNAEPIAAMCAIHQVVKITINVDDEFEFKKYTKTLKILNVHSFWTYFLKKYRWVDYGKSPLP